MSLQTKLLILLLCSLSVVAGGVTTAFYVQQQQSTIESFTEQQNTLLSFATANIEFALASGSVGTIQNIFDRLESYSIFHGAVVFDAENTQLLVRPEGLPIPPSLVEDLLKARNIMRGDIAYEVTALKDDDETA